VSQRREDTGFTLIEVAIALALLSIVLLPLASVFYGGETAAANNREYGDAIAIANGQLAQASGTTYANLGFYENQFGTPPLTIAGYNGQPAVDLGASPPAGVSPQVQPTSTPQRVGTIVYTARNYIVWVNGSGGKSYAYKQAYSVVSWNEHGHGAQVVQSILVYPGGLGKYTGPQNNTPGGTTTTPDNVAGLAVGVPADPAGETQVNLTWTAPVNMPGYYVAEWAADPGGQLHVATPNTTGSSSAWAPSGSSTSGSILATATTFTVTGLAPSTAYWFELVAFSSDGIQWAISQTWVTATTLSAPPQPCTLNTLTVSQPGQSAGVATVAKSNGHLIQPIAMTVTYSGTCTSAADAVTVAATSSGADPGSPYSLAWGASQYTLTPTLCPNAGFNTGTHTYTVSHNGTATSITAQVSFSQDKHTAPAC
jgi:prepilin-type N-terminal cleavage/methylation domain-containing protein